MARPYTAPGRPSSTKSRLASIFRGPKEFKKSAHRERNSSYDEDIPVDYDYFGPPPVAIIRKDKCHTVGLASKRPVTAESAATSPRYASIPSFGTSSRSDSTKAHPFLLSLLNEQLHPDGTSKFPVTKEARRAVVIVPSDDRSRRIHVIVPKVMQLRGDGDTSGRSESDTSSSRSLFVDILDRFPVPPPQLPRRVQLQEGLFRPTAPLQVTPKKKDRATGRTSPKPQGHRVRSAT
ncbi:hypothetical protein FRB99_003382, partial [Tulasnella sp. 403]